MTVKRTLVALLLLTALPLSAGADYTRPGHVQLYGALGYSTALIQDWRGDGAASLQLGANIGITKNLTAELSGGYLGLGPYPYLTFTTAAQDFPGTALRTALIPVTAGLTCGAQGLSRPCVYLAGGAGVYVLRSSQNFYSLLGVHRTRLGYYAGGGFLFPLRALALRLDGRFHFRPEGEDVNYRHIEVVSLGIASR